MPDNFYAAGLHRKPALFGHLQHITGETSPELPVQEGDSRRSKRGESRRTGEAFLTGREICLTSFIGYIRGSDGETLSHRWMIPEGIDR